MAHSFHTEGRQEYHRSETDVPLEMWIQSSPCFAAGEIWKTIRGEHPTMSIAHRSHHRLEERCKRRPRIARDLTRHQRRLQAERDAPDRVRRLEQCHLCSEFQVRELLRALRRHGLPKFH